MNLRAINVRVGDRIEYIGPTVWRPEHKQVRKAGDIGTVTQVDPIDPPNALLVINEDPLETYPGRDGCALVAWPNYEPGLIWPEGEDVRWRRAVTKRQLALSPAQTALLLRLLAAEDGSEMRPKESSWRRTTASLAVRGLVTVTSDGAAQITDAGRATIANLRGAS